MPNPSITQFPYLDALPQNPPATSGWLANFVTVPTGFSEFIVPGQPGTPLGSIVSVSWQITDIFFRVENPSSSGNNTLQISRYTGTGAFVVTNFINDVPILIPPNTHEAPGRPWSSATINNGIVNTGDKLQTVIGTGIGASVFTVFVTLTQVAAV
jgi:hypothetical protein